MEHLTEFQKEILKECIEKKSGGLSLPMGSGKTLISLVLSIEQSKGLPIIVIVSKTLLESWVKEIKKFYGDGLRYAVFHTDVLKKNLMSFELDKETKILLTTPEMLVKFYKKYNIAYLLKDINEDNSIFYNRPSYPFLRKDTEGGFLFSTTFGCMIVDEIQAYTKCTSMRCEAMMAICSKNRWGMSGTMFTEPSIERILGYHLILDIKNFPRSLNIADDFLKSNSFKGLSQTLIYRNTNESFIKPMVNEVIISHELSREEQIIYISLKEIIQSIQNTIKMYRLTNSLKMAREYNAYLLAMLTYLRQSIISPLIPLANVFLDAAKIENKSALTSIIIRHVSSLNISKYLDSVESCKSSRIMNILETLNKHKEEKVLVFTCFRTCLDLIKSFIKDREVFTLTGNMSSQKRMTILENFEKSSDGVLILTYDIGAEGLNLQFCSTVLLTDYWWNNGKTKQAIARILRYGQTAKTVNVYHFTSNTGVEKAVFDKHSDKLDILESLNTGKLKGRITNISVKEIIRLIDRGDNEYILQKINKK